MKWLLIILFIAPYFCISQTRWNLQQCIDSAQTNNKTALLSAISIDKATIEHNQAKNNFLPSINGSLSHGYNWGQIIDPFTNTFATNRIQYNNFNISASYELFDGFRRAKMMKLSENSLSQEMINQEIALRNLHLNVISLYLETLVNEELWKASEEHLAYTRTEIDRLAQLEKSGRKIKNDILEMRSQEGLELMGVIEAKSNFLNALLELQKTMGKSFDSTVRLEPIEDFILREESDSNQEQILEAEIAKLKKSNKELQIELARSDLYPKVSISGAIGSGYSGNNLYINDAGQLEAKPFSTQFSENLYQAASVNLTIPIFNRFDTKNNIELKKLELKEEEINSNSNLLKYQEYVERLKLDIANADAKYQASIPYVEASKNNFENYQVKYKADMCTYAEYFKAKDRLTSAQSEQIRAKYTLILRKYLFEIFEN